HGHGGGGPPAGDQPAEIAARRRRGIGVHRLGVVFTGEVDDLRLRDRSPAALEYRARRIVLEIPLGRHGRRGSGKSISFTSSLTTSSTAQLNCRPFRWSRASPAEPGLMTSTFPVPRASCSCVGPERTICASATAN